MKAGLSLLAGLAALGCREESTTKPAVRAQRTEAALTRPGLVAAFGFDETSGDAVSDATGLGHDATLSGQTRTTGKYGGALQFSGSLLTTPDSNHLDVTTGLTLEAWVKPEGVQPAWPTVLAKEGPESGFSYLLYSSPPWGEPRIYVHTGEWRDATGGNGPPENEWTHLAATYDGAELKLYINGDLGAARPLNDPLVVTSGPLNIGGNSIWADENFLGAIDEVRIYDRALSESEIEADMATAIASAPDVIDTTPPTVAITAPAPGSVLSGVTMVEVDVADAIGIRNVQFLLDGAPLGSPVLRAPYRYSWFVHASPPGAHTLRARVTDWSGNAAESAPIAVTVAQGPRPWGLVAAYGFDEGSGELTHDASGAGHHTVLDGQAWTAGRYGNALRFDGTLLTVEDTDELDLTTGMTVSAWVVPIRTTPEWRPVLVKEGGAHVQAYGLYVESPWWHAQAVVGSNGAERFVDANRALPAKAWSHLATTYDGSQLRIYVDGELRREETVEAPLATSRRSLTIGGSALWEQVRFHGVLDEIRVYNRALSATELQADMGTPINAGSTPDTTPPTVTLTAPSSGPASGVVTLVADAADAGGVRDVRFLVDGVPLGDPVALAPYQKSWHAASAAPGSHVLQAEATDQSGNATLSAPVTVTVAASETIPGLVLAFGFDEGEGDSIVDASGAGHDTWLAGQTRTRGKFGGALAFEGNVLTAEDSDLLDLSNMTLSAWVAPSLAPADWRAVVFKEGWQTLAYALFSDSHWRQPLGMFISGDEEHVVRAANAALSPGVWSHLATTYDGSELKLYVNGMLRGQQPSSAELVATAHPLLIGASSAGAGQGFVGRIDEVRIYDRALSAGEIQTDMATPITDGALADTTPPTVSWIAPASGLVASGMVTLEAEASDDAALAGVRFLLDGAPIGEVVLAAPYRKSWHASSATPGSHVLQAEAFDSSGNMARTPPVDVTVDAAGTVPGLVLAFGFDETSGEAVTDATGAGHGTALSGQARVTGKYGGALEFDENVLTVQDSELLDLSTGMTLSAWVMPNTSGEVAWRTVFSKEVEWEISYSLTANSLWAGPRSQIRIGEFVDQSATAADQLAAMTWSHVAATYDGEVLRVFVNGVLASEVDGGGAIKATSGSLIVGGSELFDDQYFSGRLDELRIYNRALSPAELAADMATPITAGAPADTTPPAVSLTAPTAGTAAGLVTLEAAASDTSGIHRVRFLVDGVAIGAPVPSPPYRKAWLASAAAPGPHTLRAEATDGAGNVALSAPVTVTVNAGDTIPGLVAAFAFEEGSGSVTHDSTAAAHQGELDGQIWTTGKYGNALDFQDGIVRVPGSEFLDLTTGMTLSAWVMPTGASDSWRTVFSKEGDWRVLYSLGTSAPWSGPYAHLDVEQSGYTTWAGDRLPAGTWSHVASTYDGEVLRLYVNGVLANAAVVGGEIMVVNGVLALGGSARYDEQYFSGRLDELRVYNRPLSEVELQADMARPIRAGAAPDTTAPTVSLTAPGPGSASGLVTVEASASDPSGIRGVRFLVDGVAIGGPVASPPYRKTWLASAATPGPHSLQAEATDGAGNVALSTAVLVTVNAGDTVPGLVAAFGFDEGSGTVTRDSTAAAHEGVLAGPLWAAGKYGSSLEFDDDVLTIADSDFLDLTTGMTLSAWVMPTGVHDNWWRTVLMKEGESELVYSLTGDSPFSGPTTYVRIDGHEHFTGAENRIESGTWTHLASTYDGETLRLYVDGELSEELALDGALMTTSGPLRIGSSVLFDDQDFFGRIDELRIYNRALSLAELEADRNRPISEGPAPDTTPPLVSVTAPASGSSVSGSVLLTAEASDPSGIAAVRFFVDGQVVGGPISEAPFRTIWNASAASAGSHSIEAEAVDRAGNVARSAALDVTVTTGPPACDPATVDDGNPCTTDTCSPEGAQVFTPLPAGTSCENGDRCDGVESCSAAGVCQPGTAPTLDATCDGVDDDCDGQNDENFAGSPTTCGVGACARAGSTACQNGAVVDTCAPGTPAASDQSCNGVDDDCNGQNDEDYVSVVTTCGTGACARAGSTSCENGSVSDSCSAGTPATSDASCNGVDDDCDGPTDEDYVSVVTSCGTGACARQGSSSCVNGSVSTGCAPGAPAADDSICNGVDDDCDGPTDEEYVDVPTSCGTGACNRSGAIRCVAGEIRNECQPAAPAANDQSCNGVDDDCNGQTDEDYVSQPTTCGAGACVQTGSTSCVGGAVVDSCNAGNGSADTVCNGIDDDCDGQTDEDYVVASTACGVGACARTGTVTCENGSTVIRCAPGQPAADDALCNGLDDDCDARIDEDYAGTPTSCGIGGCTAAGVTRCLSGSIVNDCVPGTPAESDASCNGIDDDCNGQNDEDYVPVAASCGVGACARSGTTHCSSGAVTSNCVPGTPAESDASCNGIDDDCSGQSDEDYAPIPTSCGVGGCSRSGVTSCEQGAPRDTCAPGTPAANDALCDGIDADCNGQVDEDFVSTPTTCGAGSCASAGVTSCQNGAVFDSCSAGTAGGSDNVCDGVDADCSGQVDEDYSPRQTSCGVGACASTGVTSCTSGVELDSCTPGNAAASDASCNGVDDDCDGSTDEDYAPVVAGCGVGACASTGVTRCESGTVTSSCTSGAPAASDADCDGVDDDCNGQADEDFTPLPSQCGVGACARTGTRSCVNGALVSDCAPGAPAPDDSICNGSDDDCDGNTDEEFVELPTSCGTGVCSRSGAIRCVTGAIAPFCEPGTPAPNDASCNGADDDCNGQVDEDFAPVPTTCGVGACSANGTTACVSGSVVDSCAPGTGSADTVCNGIDDDCDGSADEDYVPAATSCGVGACAAAGTIACQNGATVTVCTAGQPAADDSLCNGIDDDCDGSADEDFTGVPTSCGVGACAAAGTTRCLSGSVVNDCVPGTPAPSDASCNGLDEDCSGTADEDYAPQPTSCGVGACRATGATRCESGQVSNDCTPGAPGPSDETCDGVDQDCSGGADEDYAPEATSCGVGACRSTGNTRCEAGVVVDGCAPGIPGASDADCDGVDDDCNGTNDEDYAPETTSCGVGACRSSGATACRAGAVVDSCAPGTPAAADTTCNGVDDDCSGQTDEDYASEPTSCGVGACRSSGTTACQAGAVVDSCAPGAPAGNDSDCDGVDDDCDGSADEAFAVSCAGDSVQRCTGGALQTIGCSDDDACNGQERCTAGTCIPGTPPTVNDQNPCTSDGCEPATGVTHAPLAVGSSCGTARACDGQGNCLDVPVITAQPQSMSVSPGQPYALSVTAAGSQLSYQWRRLGQIIPGATAPTYVQPAALLTDDGAEFTVVVQNPAGSVTSSPATVTLLDTGGPNLTVDGPIERTVDTDLVTLTGSATDAASGVAAVVIRSDRYGGALAAVLSAATGAFSAEVPLFVGANALTVVATDRQSNETQRNLILTLSVAGVPRVTITDPAPGFTTQAETVTLRGVVRSSLPPESIRLVLGTEVRFASGSGGEYGFEFPNVRLALGQNVLTVRGEISGASTTAQTIVTRTEGGGSVGAAPVVRVTGARSEQFVATNAVAIKGTVTADTCVESVSVNGQTATLIGAGSEISFETSLTLPAGDTPVPVNVQARDCSDRVGTLEYTLLHDAVRPVITSSLSPEPDVHPVSATPFTITGTIIENYLAGVSANNQSIGVLPGTAGRWDFTVSVPLVRGENAPLVIEAWDQAGNHTTHTLRLRFDGSFGVEILAPARGSELLAVNATLEVDVVARAQGLAADQVLTAHVDGGAPVVLTRAGSTFTGRVGVGGATATHELSVAVRAAGGQVLEQAVLPFRVKSASEVPLTAVLRDPPNDARNIEANQVVTIELSRPIDPARLTVTVRETAHGKAYKELPSGAGIADFTAIELVDVSRNDELVPGGISYLPGDRVIAFYPERDFAYGGTVAIRVMNDGTELLRSSFTVRPLPTLISGFVADQFLNPLEGMEVRLEGTSVTTHTNREGAFSFGFGKYSDSIPGGRHLLVVNPALKNPKFGTIQQWAFTQEGRVKDLGVVRTPLLSPDEPFRRIVSGSEAHLLGGRLVYDLRQASLVFPDGGSEGDVHAELLLGPAVGYRAQPLSIPFITYALQPMGVQVSGAPSVDFALPEERGGATYLNALPDRVLLSGLDPRALEIVPVGVGHVDRENRRVRSEGALTLERLDFLALTPLRSDAEQALLASYAAGTLSLRELVARLSELR